LSQHSPPASHILFIECVSPHQNCRSVAVLVVEVEAATVAVAVAVAAVVTVDAASVVVVFWLLSTTNSPPSV